MLTLWFHRIIGTLTAGAFDCLSLYGLLAVQVGTVYTTYYNVNIVPFPPHRGGIFGIVSYWIKRGRPRR